MKQYIKKLLIFALLSLISVMVYSVLKNPVASEVDYVLSMAGEINAYTQVIIGDSVGRQIFSQHYQEETDNICYLASNQAITMTGQYLLLVEYLKTNPDIEKVAYVGIPQALTNSYNFDYTYQYFIVPFFNNETKKYLDEETIDTLYSKFGEAFVNNRFIKLFISNNPIALKTYLNYCSLGKNSTSNLISNETMEYIKEIDLLCKQNGITFEMLSPPVSESVYQSFNFAESKQRTIKNELENLMFPYYDSVAAVDDSNFIDLSHYTADYLMDNRSAIAERILSLSGLHQ